MKKFIYITIFLFLIAACENKTSRVERKKQPIVENYIKSPVFNEDSALYFLEKQLSFGFRVPNTEPHVLCGNWLVKTLEKNGAIVYEQHFQKKAYDNNILILRNIIAEFQPENPYRVLLAAHWDSRHIADRDETNKDEPIFGANDGASGVACLLEIARILQSNNPKIGIDIILFDGEDYGQPENSDFPTMENSWCFGSQHWAREKHKKGYVAQYGILLDMVGAKDAKFAKEGVSKYFAPTIVEKVWKTASRIGYGNFFIQTNSPEITDDHLYINQIAKIPTIDIVEYDPNAKQGYFAHYHHTHKDNIEIIDKNTLKAVGQTVIDVIWNEKK